MGVNPNLHRLAARPTALSGMTSRIASMNRLAKMPTLPLGQKVNVYNIPVSLKSVNKLAYVRKPALRSIASTPIEMKQLSFAPKSLQNISKQDLAQVVQKDLHLIQPKSALNAPMVSGYNVVGPHSVSLHALMGAEARR